MSVVTDEHSPAFRTLAHTLGFTEGPVWTPSGRLFVTSVNRGIVYEVFLDGRTSVAIAETGGGPNGMTLGSDGALWVTQNGGHAMPSRSLLPTKPGLQRVRIDTATVSPIPAIVGLTSPSDSVADDRGRIWFTDPDGHSFGADARPGRVLCHEITTGKTEIVAEDVYFPNGIAIDPDGRALYVAETARDRVTRFMLTQHGIRRDDTFNLRVGTPDGLAVDARGGIWVAGSRSGQVSYFDADGKKVTALDVGAGTMPTSVCFAGPGLGTLVITVAKGGRVLGIDVDTPGLPVPTRVSSTLAPPPSSV